MSRLCERPGCSQPAEVIYGIDTEALTVWIEAFESAVGYRAGVLCRRHADSMVVPLGWMLDDRRTIEPQLFTPREAPALKQRVKRTRHAPRDDTGQLSLDDAKPTDGDHGGNDRGAWMPVFDQKDDLGGLLAPTGPLMARAFGRRAQRPS